MYKVDNHPILNNHKGLYATQFISKNSVVFDVSKLPVSSENNVYAITICKNKYLDTTRSDTKYINHCCNPTLVFDTNKLIFIANRDIQINDMLTFDYTLTEIDISAPFNCVCNTANCKGYIGTK